MKPIDKIRDLYRRFPQKRGMLNDMMAHLETGYIISTPQMFLMGRAVRSDAVWQQIVDPWHVFSREEQDTWLIWAFAGTSQNILTHLPYPLTWVAWSRRNEPLRFYPLTRLCSKISNLKGA